MKLKIISIIELNILINQSKFILFHDWNKILLSINLKLFHSCESSSRSNAFDNLSHENQIN